MDSFASAMAADAPRALASAVVVQAIKDFRGIGRRSRSRENAAASIAEAEARHFLTDEKGRWARARVDWCAIAEVDPDQLRRLVISGRLEGAAGLFRTSCDQSGKGGRAVAANG